MTLASDRVEMTAIAMIMAHRTTTKPDHPGAVATPRLQSASIMICSLRANMCAVVTLDSIGLLTSVARKASWRSAPHFTCREADGSEPSPDRGYVKDIAYHITEQLM